MLKNKAEKANGKLSWKSWSTTTIIVLIGILVLISLLVYVVDPYIHYHKPLSKLSFQFPPQRYGSYGIEKFYSYDSIIIGNSMAENYKTSEFDSMFHANSIKITMSGSYLQEMSQNLSNAFASPNKIKTVLWSVNYPYLLFQYDYKEYDDSEYPYYLYDQDVFNDVYYLLNQITLYRSLDILKDTLQKKADETFDHYSSWTATTGKAAILAKYHRVPIKESTEAPSDGSYSLITLNHNIIPLLEQNPETKFILFFPPYSILWWDELIRNNALYEYMDAEATALTALLQYDNVEIYCFHEAIEVYSNLDNYSDSLHFTAAINSWILQQIANQQYRITLENLHSHLSHVEKLVTTYDYDRLFQNDTKQ
jgi:hypothetical protein